MTLEKYGFINRFTPVGDGANLLFSNESALVDAIRGFGVSTLEVDVAGDGVTDDYDAFVDLLALADARGGPIIITKGTYLIGTNLDITHDIVFVGGILKPASGVTIKIKKALIAPLSKIFDAPRSYEMDMNGTGGKIVFTTNGPVRRVYPEWWGAITTKSTLGGLTFDCAPFIQAAIDSVSFDKNIQGFSGEGTENAGYSQAPEVIFSGQVYNIYHPIFVGYNFTPTTDLNKITDFSDTRSSDNTNPSYRKNAVLLSGRGTTYLLVRNPSNFLRDAGTGQMHYAIYYSAWSSIAHKMIDNLYIGCQRYSRGVIVDHLGYACTISNLSIKSAQQVGLDLVNCWGGDVSHIGLFDCYGIGLRNTSVNNVVFNDINVQSCSLWRSVYFPKTTESNIKMYNGSSVATAVKDRAAVILYGDKVAVDECCFESINTSIPYRTTISAVTGSPPNYTFKLKLSDHALVIGNKVRLEYDCSSSLCQKSFTGAVSNVESNYFYVNNVPTTATVGSDCFVYRVFDGITKGVVTTITCNNHDLETGKRIRIIIPDKVDGITELDGNLYTVTVIDANTFTVPEDTSASSGTYQGDEYLKTSYPLLCSLGGSTTIRTIRTENNVCADSLFVVEATTQDASSARWGIIFDSLSAANAYNSDYMIDFRAASHNCEVRNMSPIVVNKACVRFTNDQAEGYHMGNIIHGLFTSYGVRYTEGAPSLKIVEFAGAYKDNHKYNLIQGVYDTLKELENLNVPSVIAYTFNDASSQYRSLTAYYPQFSVTTGTQDIYGLGFKVLHKRIISGPPVYETWFPVEALEGMTVRIYFKANNTRQLTHYTDVSGYVFAEGEYPLKLRDGTRIPDDEVVVLTYTNGYWYEN